MRQNDQLIKDVEAAFLRYGYERLTMSALAEACRLSRRALYNHFPNKLEAFRAMFRHGSAAGIDAGMEAASQAQEAGKDAAEVLTAAIAERYGTPRRVLNTSPHRTEINNEAFRSCRDIMVELADRFHADLVRLIGELEASRGLRLRSDVSAADLAQLLTDGARGVGQSIPVISDEEMPERYRRICTIILRGCAEAPDDTPSEQPRC